MSEWITQTDRDIFDGFLHRCLVDKRSLFVNAERIETESSITYLLTWKENGYGSAKLHLSVAENVSRVFFEILEDGTPELLPYKKRGLDEIETMLKRLHAETFGGGE